MNTHLLENAKHARERIERGESAASWFSEALSNVPPLDRDAWIDEVFNLGTLPEDGPALPSGCVPYLPCSVDALLRTAKHARIGPHDVFVDIGAGVGRAAALMHLLTGASAIGIEIQPGLVARAHELATRLRLSRVSFVQGDAVELASEFVLGTVFFLYCPFSGQRLVRMLGRLEAIARARTIRVCCVDLPLPPCSWLELEAPHFPDVAMYRSTRLQ
ncbi:MAG: methyltransferase domain-containing protein [Polyangiaceae bacterium]|nr:methyltransferase domain-containing protein [Polyangiaceae bacterium]